MSISYTKIPEEFVKETLLNTYDHHTGHIRLFFTKNDKLITISGQNAKYKNIAAFGGFSEPGENLMQTLIREYMEESLGAVTSAEVMEQKLLEHCIIIKRITDNKTYYTVFCNFENSNFDLEIIRQKFKEERNKDNLTPGQLENDDIVFVDFDEIEKGFNPDNEVADVFVKNSLGETGKIRGITMPAYVWFIKNGLFTPK